MVTTPNMMVYGAIYMEGTGCIEKLGMLQGVWETDP